MSDTTIVIDDNRKETNSVPRQRLPLAIEQEMKRTNVRIQACTFTFQTPVALKTFLGRLSETQKSLLRNLNLVLLAFLEHRYFLLYYTSTFGEPIDPGWRVCFRALPPKVRNINFDLACPMVLDEDVPTICQYLSEYSKTAYLRTSGKLRF